MFVRDEGDIDGSTGHAGTRCTNEKIVYNQRIHWNVSVSVDRLTSQFAFLFYIEFGAKIDDDRVNLGISE